MWPNDVLKTILRTRGYEVARVGNLGGFLASRGCDLLIDVGANTGQFATQARKMGYRGRILSIEPASQPFAGLSAKARRDPLWDVANIALGAQREVLSINVTGNSVYSSFQPMTDLALELADTEVVRVEEVQVETLDDLTANNLAERPFLKIDTQGFEQPVLAGAQKFLKRCVGVLLELPVDHLYGGVWSFSEAIAWMEGEGFDLAQVRQVNCRAGGDLQAAMEFDCLFRRH